jgi:uncharacterized membrane protein
VRITWKTELPALLIVAAMFVLAALNWNSVPARVPVHWALDGRPDGWSSRGVGLLALPASGLFLYVLLTIVPFVDPGRANYVAFAGSFRLLRVALLGFLFVLQIAMVEAFHGMPVNMNAIVLPLIGGLLLVLGVVIPKLRPNWAAGIRTPWTLSSRAAWDGTHRAGGTVFLVLGVLWIACAFVRRPWALDVALGAVVVAALGLVLYSYVLWRDDPGKVPPGGGPS